MISSRGQNCQICRQDRHDGGVHKGGGGGVRSVDASQKESHGQEDVDQEDGTADRSTGHMKAQRSSSSASMLGTFRMQNM